MDSIITEKEIRSFLNKYVGIAVGNWKENSPCKYFWNFGFLIEIADGSLKIQTRDGFRIIEISDIREIKEGEIRGPVSKQQGGVIND